MSNPDNRPQTLDSWKRFSYPYIYAGRLEYNELVDEFTIRVIQPGQVAEIHGDDKFITFTVQSPLTDYIKKA